MEKKDIAAEMEAIKVSLEALSKLDDSQQKFVVDVIAKRLGIVSADSPNQKQDDVITKNQQNGAPLGSTGSDSALSPKQFMSQKMPNTDVQRVACLAFYLAHNRGVAHFKTNELTKLNSEAAQSNFSNAAYAVTNATNAKFLSPVGGGRKQITTLGETVVQALPDQEAVKEAMKRHPVRKRKVKKKK